MEKQTFERPAARKRGSETDQWMYETMAEILGKTDEDLKEFSDFLPYRMIFNKFWSEASEEERVKFVERTRFSDEIPEYKQLVSQFREQYIAMLPPRGMTKSESVEYYLAPKYKTNVKQPKNQQGGLDEDQWFRQSI